MKYFAPSRMVSFAAASCFSQHAWSYTTSPSVTFHTSRMQQQQRRISLLHSSGRSATAGSSSCNSLVRRRGDLLSTFVAVAKEGEAFSTSQDRPFSIPLEKEAETEDGAVVVAEGAIVAQFAGGLTAVRVLDDLSMPSGPVTLTSNGTASASATGDDLQGRNVVFPDGSRGVVVVHRPPVLFVYHTSLPLSNADLGQERGLVQILNSRVNVRIPEQKSVAVGVKDILEVEGEGTTALFSPIPQVKDIALINNPMLTGVTMFDVLSPIGRGQNMLFLGHDIDDMRKYTVDFLSSQLKFNKDVACVYAAIDDADKVQSLLEEQGIRQHVQVVASASSSSDGNQQNVDEMSKAAEAVAIASTACAIAASMALNEGAHSIVIVDTLDWHKKLWDGTTRVLVDVFGVDAVVRADREGGASSEMRAFYSTLVQRAAQYNAKRGGGSVTLLMLTQILRMQNEDTVYSESDFENSSAKVKDRIKLLTKRNIPLTAETLRKIDIPIPSAWEGKRRLVLQHVDDLISMTDGQIWLDEKLEMAGQLPPMDPQKSVTRIGIGADTDSRADAPALRRIVEGLRLILSQAANMVGAEANTASEKQIRRQKAFLLSMYQKSGSGGRTLSESCAALLAASRGYLDGAIDSGALAGTEKGEAFMQSLLQHLQSSVPDLMREIDTSLDLTEGNKALLSETIESFMRV